MSSTDGRLRHAASGASIVVPQGWQVVEDVGAVTCEAPAARADVTGRVVAARVSIERVERRGLVPQRPLDVLVRDLVDDARTDHPHAWLLDCVPWDVPPLGETPSGSVLRQGVRVDVAHHDMSTPLVVSTVLVQLEDGLLRVTASVPVAHQRSLGADVDDALDSLRLERPALEKAVGVAVTDVGALPLAYASPSTWITAAALDVFVTGSYKIASRWRAEPLAAGLVDQRGVATSLGGFVRRAISRPDVRAGLTVWPVDLLTPASGQGAAGPRAVMTVDRLDGYAVLRATAPPARTDAAPPVGQEYLSLEVLDLAAAPARAAAWLGVGPGRATELPEGTVAVLGTARSPAPGARAERGGTFVSALPGPRQVWVRLLDALG